MQPLQPDSFCLQNESKSGCLLLAGRPICFTLVSLSLSLLSLVPNTHKHAHAHTRRYTQNGRTPLVLRRLLLKADEMKVQLAFVASSNRYSLADKQNACTAKRSRSRASAGLSLPRRVKCSLSVRSGSDDGQPPLPSQKISAAIPAHLSVRLVYTQREKK